KRDAAGGLLFFIIIFGILCYLGYFKYIIIFWSVPLITTFPVLGWCIELPEHYPMVHSNTIDLYMSRNRFSHWLEAIFLSIHYENYHLIHHLRPGIPFWNMKKAHEIFMEDSNYARANAEMGGAIVSSNKNKSTI